MRKIHSKSLFIQEKWKLFIQRKYSFKWKMDYRPGLSRPRECIDCIDCGDWRDSKDSETVDIVESVEIAETEKTVPTV